MKAEPHRGILTRELAMAVLQPRPVKLAMARAKEAARLAVIANHHLNAQLRKCVFYTNMVCAVTRSADARIMTRNYQQPMKIGSRASKPDG